jgi:hypothetical protein
VLLLEAARPMEPKIKPTVSESTTVQHLVSHRLSRHILSPFPDISAMATNGSETSTLVVTDTTQKKKKKQLKPARKQVKPGEVEHKAPVQTGKEYSTFLVSLLA